MQLNKEIKPKLSSNLCLMKFLEIERFDHLNVCKSLISNLIVSVK